MGVFQRGFLIFMMVTLWGINTYAQDANIFKREGYDRIVIDGIRGDAARNGENSYQVTVSDSSLIPRLTELTSPAIQTITANGNVVTLSFNDIVTDMRSFSVANRFILDVYYPVGAVVTPSPQETDRPDPVSQTPAPLLPTEKPVIEANETQAEEPVENTQDENGPDENQSAEIETQETVEPDVATPPVIGEEQASEEESAVEEEASDEVIDGQEPRAPVAGTLPVIEEPAPAMPVSETASTAYAQPTIITASSIDPFSLAVFNRFDRLFIVTDDKTLTLPPQISGAGKELNWQLNEIPSEAGKAWMMPIPSGSKIRAEGGGIVWRIILSDEILPANSASVSPNFDDVRNPSVVIDIGEPSDILKITDPDYGDDLAVFTVDRAGRTVGIPYDFVDFDILPAISGVVVKPESDGLKVSAENNAIIVTKNDGLIVSDIVQEDIARSFVDEEGDTTSQNDEIATNRLFFFDDWANTILGAPYIERRQALSDELAKAATEEEKTTILLNLAKMHLSENMGAEALGYLDMVADGNDNIAFVPQYWALKGAAHYLAGQFDTAADIFSNDMIANNAEITVWRAAALAANEQNDDALALYREQDVDITNTYPIGIKLAVMAPMMEALLTDDKGIIVLDMVNEFTESAQSLTRQQRAAWAYLKGKAQQTSGYPEEADKNLKLAVKAEPLGPYGARAELALIQAERKADRLSVEDALKRMERLRFIWRGDDLEIQIYDELGRLYIENGEQRRGLGLLQRAAELTTDPVARRDYVRRMSDVYKDIFLGESFESLDPMEAISVYDEFRELTPVNAEGDQIINKLVDKLVEIDLMSRAVTVLQDKMERLESGEEAIRTGLRIAAIQLIDRRPEGAMETLTKVDNMLRAYQADNKPQLNEKVIKLKARALADSGQYQAALFMTEGLPDTNEVLSLRVDTAWAAGEWVAAADNMQKLIDRENLDTAEELTDMQARMILNQAVALQLSDQDDALQIFADKYNEVMENTSLSRTFKVVTRPLNVVELADRQTLLDMTSEVDLFSGFLEETDGL